MNTTDVAGEHNEDKVLGEGTNVIKGMIKVVRTGGKEFTIGKRGKGKNLN